MTWKIVLGLLLVAACAPVALRLVAARRGLAAARRRRALAAERIVREYGGVILLMADRADDATIAEVAGRLGDLLLRLRAQDAPGAGPACPPPAPAGGRSAARPVFLSGPVARGDRRSGPPA